MTVQEADASESSVNQAIGSGVAVSAVSGAVTVQEVIDAHKRFDHCVSMKSPLICS